MCGILGRIDHNIVDLIAFRQQLEQINHRGPDGDGIQTLFEGKVVLGHKRLSIIDLSDTGAQPMCNEDGSIWVTFNGEIYNYPELKKELLTGNHVFKSNSDTEVLIHGYEEWGLKGLVDRLKGMFAFAIWDAHKQQLFAARDRFGIKPFYYTNNGNSFTFASELKAIIGFSDFDQSLNKEAIADFLVYRFIPAPKTIYNAALKLPPASTLVYDYESGKLEIQTYWSPAEHLGNNKNKDYKEEVEIILSSSIKDHLLSDVPVGVFLSGGYDSSALVHYMSQYEHDIATFSIGFHNWPNSEHLDARIVAERYGTSHTEKVLGRDIQDQFEKYAFHYDEPLGGSSFMPTFSVSNLASSTHKVVLGGDGGDEIFAGYKWYYKVMEYRKSNKGRLSKLVRNSDQLLKLYHNQMSWSGFDYQEAKQLLNGETDVKESIWLYKQFDQSDASDLKRMQLIDMHTFLPEVINTKVDRASMAYSLEVRVPFLNHKLAEKVLGLNDSLYYQQGVNKKLLKSYLEPHLPKEIINKKKQGFGAPVSYDKNFENLTRGCLVKAGLLNDNMVAQYIEQKNQAKLWPLFILENWFKHWHS